MGGRNANWATEFTLDCAAGIKGRVRVITDGHKPYLEAVETAFGADCDYKRLTAESDDFSSEGSSSFGTKSILATSSGLNPAAINV